MSRYALLLLLTVSLSAAAEDLLPIWNVQCTSDRSKCWLEILVSFHGAKKQERGGVALAYDGTAKKPMYVTIFIPPDTGKKDEVIVSFVDSVPDGDTWKLEPAKSGMMSLPVMECDRQFCMARVYPQIDNGDGTTTDLFAELQARRFLWVAFKQNGKLVRFLVPISGFPPALAQANGEPSVSNNPVQPASSGTADR